MRITIEENAALEEDEVVIRCKAITTRHLQAIELLKASSSLIAYKGNEAHRVPVDDILYCEVLEKQLFLYTQNEVYSIKQRLSDMEQELGPDFVRISRVSLVNWRKIDAIKPMLNGRLEAQLENKEKLIISRQYVKEIKQRFLDTQE